MKTMWLFLGLAVGIISVNAHADGDLSNRQIRKLVKQGEILSLESILKKIPGDATGRLLDLEVENENENERIIYELEFLKQNGDVIELKIDAATGEILQQKVEY